MSTRERILLGLAFLGFWVPIGMTIAFFADGGEPRDYFGDFVGTLPAALLGADLIIAFFGFAFWAAWEGRRLKMASWWLPIPASLLVGLCFALPLFLYLRERTLRDGEIPTGTSRAARGPSF